MSMAVSSVLIAPIEKLVGHDARVAAMIGSNPRTSS